MCAQLLYTFHLVRYLLSRLYHLMTNRINFTGSTITSGVGAKSARDAIVRASYTAPDCNYSSTEDIGGIPIMSCTHVLKAMIDRDAQAPRLIAP